MDPRSTALVQSTTRTLVVEGDGHVRSVLTWLLEHDPRFVVAASLASGDSAVAFHHPLDAALVDLAVPGLDALSTTRLMRDRYPSLKILVMAGADVPYLRAAVLDAGADGLATRALGAAAIVDTLAALRSLSTAPPAA